MPDLTGLSLMDALALVENMGMKVEFEGEGKVINQSVAKGRNLNNVKLVKLTLK
jgi:cell division protein FtsI (penicillin-binding protein 3)